MGLLQREAIPGLWCPYCGSTIYKGPKKKFTTGGVIMFLAGVLLAPVCIGLLLILVSFRMREVKYKCGNCKKLF